MIKNTMEVSSFGLDFRWTFSYQNLENRQDGDGLLQREEFSQAVKQLLAEYQRVGGSPAGCSWVGGLGAEGVGLSFFFRYTFYRVILGLQVPVSLIFVA